MELGGNAPFLVFDDADIDDAVEGAIIAKLRNIARPAPPPTGFFHVAAAAGRRVRLPARRPDGQAPRRPRTEEGVDLGPLIDEDQRSKVAELVDRRRLQGREGDRRRPAPRRRRVLLRADGPRRRPRRRPGLREEIFGPVPAVATDAPRCRRTIAGARADSVSLTCPRESPLTSSERHGDRAEYLLPQDPGVVGDVAEDRRS